MNHLEALVFLVSCLCHDIDHRGTNNSFQTKSSTVLASLYSSEGSVMEVNYLQKQNCKINYILLHYSLFSYSTETSFGTDYVYFKYRRV